jgi:uncharacterized protein
MTAITVQTYNSAADFLERVRTQLEKNEVAHNLLLGLGQRLADQPDAFASTPYFVTVDRGSAAGGKELLLAGLRTPPYNLILGSESDAAHQAVPALVGHLLPDQPDLPGVLARSPLAETFAREWSQQSRRTFRLAMSERVFELRRVNPIRGVPGRMRPAEASDLPLLSRWMRHFNLEALGKEDPLAYADKRLWGRLAETFLWEDARPVSLACIARYTPHGAIVGPVYTPTEERGHGYASACVAALSQSLLDRGRTFCALFTNLANPTSNHIYQDIGYEPREDFSEIHFQE